MGYFGNFREKIFQRVYEKKWSVFKQKKKKKIGREKILCDEKRRLVSSSILSWVQERRKMRKMKKSGRRKRKVKSWTKFWYIPSFSYKETSMYLLHDRGELTSVRLVMYETKTRRLSVLGWIGWWMEGDVKVLGESRLCFHLGCVSSLFHTSVFLHPLFSTFLCLEPNITSLKVLPNPE